MMHVETTMQALTDKATGVTFAPKLDDRRYLVGVAEVIHSITEYPKEGQQNKARIALRDAARTFESLEYGIQSRCEYHSCCYLRQCEV